MRNENKKQRKRENEYHSQAKYMNHTLIKQTVRLAKQFRDKYAIDKNCS